VLREGRIVEEGTHAALLAQGGHYAQLYNTYFRHQSPDYRPGEGCVAVRAGDERARCGSSKRMIGARANQGAKRSTNRSVGELMS
jgi:hypothetical protein